MSGPPAACAQLFVTDASTETEAVIVFVRLFFLLILIIFVVFVFFCFNFFSFFFFVSVIRLLLFSIAAPSCDGRFRSIWQVSARAARTIGTRT